MRDAGSVKPDFGGTTAQLYVKYRRDLPTDQATALAEQIGLDADDVVVDLGCGTGQLAVPLQAHCAAIIGIDPEPAMLAELRARQAPRVLCLLGDDHDLPRLGAVCGRSVGAVVIGNALHWMDEKATLIAAAALLRPGGAVAVITQGPPLWLGTAPWQVRVRQILQRSLGSVTGNCRTDQSAIDERLATVRALDLEAHVLSWHAEHVVDIDWVLGHLGSAMSADQLLPARAALTDALQNFHEHPLVERITTTALIAHRRS